MSTLTDATREQAKSLFVSTTRTCREVCSLAYYGVDSIINALTTHRNKKNFILSVQEQDQYDYNLVVEWQEDLSEEEVLKEIRRRININNARNKALKKEALPKAERIALEIKELEKKLARERKKLEKL